MRWAIGVAVICGVVIGYHIRLFAEVIRENRALREQEKAARRERMGFTTLSKEEDRAFRQIQRGYKQTAKEDR